LKAYPLFKEQLFKLFITIVTHNTHRVFFSPLNPFRRSGSSLARSRPFFSIPTARRLSPQPLSRRPPCSALWPSQWFRALGLSRPHRCGTAKFGGLGPGEESPDGADPLRALSVDRPIRASRPARLGRAARAKTAVESGRGEGLSAVHPVVQRAWKAG
jgi:hypothetical protein